MKRGRTFRKGRNRIVGATLGEAEAIVLAPPTGGQVCQPSQKSRPFLRSKSGDEVAPLAKHVEQIEDCQDHVEVGGREQRSQVLHRRVEVTRKGVLDQEGSEAQGPKDKVLHHPVVAGIDCQGPRSVAIGGGGCRRPRGAFQYFVADIEDVDPVEKLALAVGPGLDGLKDLKEVRLVRGRRGQAFDQGLAI